MKTTLGAGGRTTIPAKIRKDHAIKPGTAVEWIDDGETTRVVPIPLDPIRASVGITKGLGKKLLIERRVEWPRP